jgi:hypothetical protein
MNIHEHTVVLMAKERMEDARRSVEQVRALRLVRTLRPSARIRLGMALVRFGHWIQGQPLLATAIPIDLRQAQS